MHFCVSATRGGFHDGFCCPRKIGTNWFMPAFVKSRFGESGRSEADGTMVCCFSRKKSRKDWRISAEVMAASIVDVAVTQRLVTARGHRSHFTLRSNCLAEGRSFVEERSLFFCVEPFHKQKHVSIRPVHDIACYQLGRRREFLADRWKRAGGISRCQLPALANETGTIDPDRFGADQLASAITFLIGINITSRFPRDDSCAETLRVVVSAPFVGDSYILRVRHPAFAQRFALAAIAIRRMNFHAVLIFSVPHIFR